MKNAIGLAVTALAFCAAGAAFASEDGGPPPMLPEEVIAIEAQSYAATYGVSEDEAGEPRLLQSTCSYAR